MRVALIEFSRKVYRMRDADKLAELIAAETDIDKAGILSHRLAELRKAGADAE